MPVQDRTESNRRQQVQYIIMYIQHWCHSAVVQSWAARWWEAASGHCDRLRAPTVSWPGNLLNSSSPSRHPPIHDHMRHRAVASGLQKSQQMTHAVIVVLTTYITVLIRLQGLLFKNLQEIKGFLCPISLFSHHKEKERNWVWSHAWTHSPEVSFPLVIPDMGSHIKSVLAGQSSFKLKWNSAAFTASVYLSYIPHHLLGQWTGSADSPGTRAGWGAAGTLGYMWWRAGWASTLLCPGALCEIAQTSKSWYINSILWTEILEEKGHILCDAKNQIIPAFTWGQSLVQTRSQQWWKWRFPFPWHHEAQLELFPLNIEAEHKGQCLWK